MICLLVLEMDDILEVTKHHLVNIQLIIQMLTMRLRFLEKVWSLQSLMEALS